MFEIKNKTTKYIMKPTILSSLYHQQLIILFLISVALLLVNGVLAYGQEENPNFEAFRNFYLGDTDLEERETSSSTSVPEWLGLSYRFLAITVGSFPITILFTTMGYDTYRTIDYSVQENQFDPTYLPLGVGGTQPPYTQEDTNRILAYSVYSSLGLATVDLMLSIIFRSRQRRAGRLFLQQ